MKEKNKFFSVNGLIHFLNSIKLFLLAFFIVATISYGIEGKCMVCLIVVYCGNRGILYSSVGRTALDIFSWAWNIGVVLLFYWKKWQGKNHFCVVCYGRHRNILCDTKK